MAYREVTMVEGKEVLRQWLSGKARKSIARWVRVNRRTSRPYIQVAKECGLQKGGGIDSLTEERFELILEALPATDRSRRRGHGWEGLRPLHQQLLRSRDQRSNSIRLLATAHLSHTTTLLSVHCRNRCRSKADETGSAFSTVTELTDRLRRPLELLRLYPVR
jgi:hypothetical protein